MRHLLLAPALWMMTCASPPLRLEVSSSHLPANGVATREVRVSGGRGRVRFEITRGGDLVEVLKQDSKRLTLRAGMKAGLVTIKSMDDVGAAEISLELHDDPSDDDQDGFPDAAELPSADERARFRARLVAVARSQRVEIDPRWSSDQRDCAGLVRFAYRESLRSTPSPLSGRVRELTGAVGWGRLRFSFPDLPLLGDQPFRLQPGAFSSPRETEDDFGAFADAKHILLYNTVALGKEEAAADSGDLLFFFHPENGNQPYHVMVYFRQDDSGWVVYHTGATAGETGRLKEIPLSRLGEHPDPSWHPRWTNENFLGYHRFKILD